jgi:hypothetical protein
MEIQKLRDLRNALPFRAFTVKLSDGRRFLVEQPYYIGFSPKQDLVLVSCREGTAWFSPTNVTDILRGNGQDSG